MTALKAFIKPFEAPQEVWKWKFNLIFISTQFSEMHRILRVKVQNILGRYSWNGLNSGFYQFFGNKAKMMNLKTGVSRKQSTPNFPKNEHFLPPDTHMYVWVSGSKKCWFFLKIWRALFSWNTRFEIQRFALLPTS